jgi:hypothetical protein
LIHAHEKAISANSQFREVIIHEPNFGCETLSHLAKSSTLLFANGFTFGVISLLFDHIFQKLNPLHESCDENELNIEFPEFIKSEIS